jgi:hypothetical protein
MDDTCDAMNVSGARKGAVNVLVHFNLETIRLQS